MALTQSPHITGREPTPTPMGTEVVNTLLSCPVATAGLVVNSIIEMGYLPEGCRFVDAVHAATDMDSGTALALSFGVVNAAGTDLDTVIQAGLTIGQAGTATVHTATLAALLLEATDAAPKKLGYKVTTAPTGAASGTIYTQLSYASK